jgi:single-strand DNA-binding protein
LDIKCISALYPFQRVKKYAKKNERLYISLIIVKNYRCSDVKHIMSEEINQWIGEDIMNKVLLTGRLTRDAELLDFNNGGRKAIRFTLAVDRRYKNSSDGKDADFIPIVYFTNHSDKLLSHMTKGKLISVAGKITVKSGSGEEDSKKYYTNVVADNIEFLASVKSQVV